MGKVFRLQEVRNHEAPQLNSFEIVGNRIGSELKESPMIGAVFCGSVIHQKHNLRSDIDCFVLYHERDKKEMATRLLSLTSFADRYYVPVDFIQLTPELAETRMHGITSSMEHHIRLSARNGGLIGKNPFTAMSLRELDHRDETFNWLRQKVRILDEGSVHRYNSYREAHFLQRLLEAPVNGTRKVLLIQGTFENDSKAAVLALTQERIPSLYAELTYFVELDRDYTTVLTQQLEHPDHNEYRDVLSFIRAEAERTSKYLKKLGQLLES